MKEYNPQEFIAELNKRTNGVIHRCPFCGNNSFSAADSFATILINNNMNAINIGPNIPAGIAICTKCGHIDFFALGVLGLLENNKEHTDGQ